MTSLAAILILLVSTGPPVEPLVLHSGRGEQASLIDHLERLDGRASLEPVHRAADDRAPASSISPADTEGERYRGRVLLQSTAASHTSWVLPLTMSEVDAILVRENGREEHHRTGWDVALSDRSFPSASRPSIRIALDPGETATLYLTVRNNSNQYAFDAEPRFVEESDYEGTQRRRDAVQMLFLGVLLALTIYKLGLFLSFRDTSYLYYVLFLVGTAAYWATKSGYIVLYLWPPDRVGATEWNFFALVLAAVSYTQFVRHFLKTPRYVRRLDLGLRAILGVWGGSALLALLGVWTIAEPLAAAAGLALLLVTFAAGVGVHRAGFEPARYYLLAASSFLLVGIGYVAIYFVAPEIQEWASGLLQAAMILEILLLALALTMRIKILSTDRAEAVAAQNLAEAKSRDLQRMNDLKTRFIGIAAHDLRSPLSTIVGYADLIEFETGGQPKVVELTGAIHRGASRMLALIEDLLVMSALETGGIELKCEHVDLRQLVCETIREYRLLSQHKRQILDVDLGPEPAWVHIDPDRFPAALGNLLSNAIKYTPEAGHIRLSIVRDGDHIRFQIGDSGPGFTDEDRDHLFEPFTRLSAQPTGGESSTGLGLTIVKQIVDLHNGEIVVTSEAGTGAVFEITLEMAPPRASPSAEAAWLVRASGGDVHRTRQLDTPATDLGEPTEHV